MLLPSMSEVIFFGGPRKGGGRLLLGVKVDHLELFEQNHLGCCHFYEVKKNLRPPIINGWNLKITQLKRTIIFQTSIFGFHVNFPGCRPYIHRSESRWLATPKRWRKVRCHDKPIFQVVYFLKEVTVATLLSYIS